MATGREDFEMEMQRFEEQARDQRRREAAIFLAAERWLSARARADERTAEEIERADPLLGKHLRAFERDESLPRDDAERRGLLGRLHETLLALRLTDGLRELVEEDCPLCTEVDRMRGH
jgi:hypothetical protein